MKRKTEAEVEAELEAAREHERRAHAVIARKTRELSGIRAATDTHRVCVLGRAWSAFADAHPEREGEMRAFLAVYITRDTDHAAFAGTRWSVSQPPAVSAAVPAEEDDYRE